MIIISLSLSLFACSGRISDETGGVSDTGPGPTAVATADPVEGTAPLEVTLSGLDSEAGSHAIASYEWTLSDGTVVTGETAATTLLDAGTHNITLEVTDEGGLSSQASVDVQVSCPAFADATEAGTMSWGEVSGLASASTEGILWAHSDAQGNGAVVYAISTDAVLQGSFTLAGVSDYDWEDIARGPGPEDGVSYLYIGDTGDNSEYRSSVKVYRFEEPTDFDGGTITGVETIELTYLDGAHDAETLLIDPLTGDLIIVERDRDDEGVSGIFVAEAPLSTSDSTELTHVGSLIFGTDPFPGDVETTGGDVSPDGTLILVRTHDEVWAFARDVSEPLYTAFDSQVCGTPEVNEAKGEAISFAWDGSGYYTGGEGSNQPLHWYGSL